MKVLACLGAVVAASLFGAVGAGAETAGTLRLSREAVAPGGSVDVFAQCSRPEVSPMLVLPTVLRVTSTSAATESVWHARVMQDAQPAIYLIAVNCGGEVNSGYLRVTRPKGAPETGGL